MRKGKNDKALLIHHAVGREESEHVESMDNIGE